MTQSPPSFNSIPAAFQRRRAQLVLLVAPHPWPAVGRACRVPSPIVTHRCDRDPMSSPLTPMVTPDLAKVEFRLNRNAAVGLSIIDSQGERMSFARRGSWVQAKRRTRCILAASSTASPTQPRSADTTYFSRTLPDGTYTWELSADDGLGSTEPVTGTLTIADADTALPGIRGFSVSPPTFSPNQDGIADRVTINLVLEKDVEELLRLPRGQNGVEHPIAEDERPRNPRRLAHLRLRWRHRCRQRALPMAPTSCRRGSRRRGPMRHRV